MPIDKDKLGQIARAYVRAMTSIRGRRVHRLLMREFSSFDCVLPANTEDGTPALLALSESGRLGLCLTNGKGAEVSVTECASLQEATLTTSYDFLKDSLPVVSWTIWHAGFSRIAGTLTISRALVADADYGGVLETFQKLGR